MNNKLTSTELQSRLLQGNFDRERSPDERFADPLMETSMIVTLEQLRPFDLNPRLIRNPNYDDIKASIRHRGLDTPPPITRRPDQVVHHRQRRQYPPVDPQRTVARNA